MSTETKTYWDCFWNPHSDCCDGHSYSNSTVSTCIFTFHCTFCQQKKCTFCTCIYCCKFVDYCHFSTVGTRTARSFRLIRHTNFMTGSYTFLQKFTTWTFQHFFASIRTADSAQDRCFCKCHFLTKLKNSVIFWSYNEGQKCWDTVVNGPSACLPLPCNHKINVLF